jgi:hypothetical protein
LALPPLPARLRAVVLSAILLLATVPAVAAGTGPAWKSLTAEQQRILAPLQDDWSHIEADRRLKWIDIAKRYPTMTPQQQERLQSRMKKWASLSHEERTEVRKRYKKLQKMPPEQRAEIQRKWQEYESLPEEEKQQLRQAHPAPAGKSKPVH